MAYNSYLKPLYDAFETTDTDHDGRIALADVGGALEKADKPNIVEQVLCMMRDQNKTDIDARGFVRLVNAAIFEDGANWEIQQKFRTLDKDKSGYISADELRKAFAEGGVLYQGFEVDKELVDDLIKECDTSDGDGNIDYIEFVPSFLGMIKATCVDGKL